MRWTEDSGNKTIFQRELEKSVSRKIALIVVIGGLFFCEAILGITMLSQRYNKEKYLDALTRTFRDVCGSVTEFINKPENRDIFLSCARGEVREDEIRYTISKYNVDAPVKVNVIVTDREDHICFSSFSGENMNLHRAEFNRIVAENARRQGDEIYRAVYYFSGDTSEYVFEQPLYEEGVYIGSAAVYLDGHDWSGLFSQYQYDAIITSGNGEIIFCSNNSFLPERNTNKYRGEGEERFLWVNDSRYLTNARMLEEENVILYSFIYSPRNYIYAAVGVATILVLGVIWTVIFLRMSSSMARKTAESVDLLVSEMRIIRKEDTGHVITIHTGDEFEEIADQINKMVKSVNELYAKNVELVTINGRMEMQNLQAQLNPHFIYNTLDNIRYLIASEPLRAAKMIGRFTHILRYSINNTKCSVFLEEDMGYIEDYLVIQKMRFGDRFSYQISVEDACGHCLIPKLLLQPLLENSIKYGFKKKAEITVWIRGWIEDDYLMLSVADNGMGVPKSTLETLRAIIRAEGTGTTHNGLQSISRRIMLEYGRDSGMLLESVEGEEFRVTLKLWMGDEKDVPRAAGGG